MRRRNRFIHSFRGLIGLIGVIGLGNMAFSQDKRAGLKVTNYHIKSDKTNWDGKNAILKLKDNVKITFYLSDQTTAYLTCDEAQENKAQGTGVCVGRSRFEWQDLEILSEKVSWDRVAKVAVFENQGLLNYRKQDNGALVMNFSRGQATLDSQNKIHWDATGANGDWTPTANFKKRKNN